MNVLRKTINLQKKYFLHLYMKAIHNKDYSVVKTFSASPICGAFFIS